MPYLLCMCNLKNKYQQIQRMVTMPLDNEQEQEYRNILQRLEQIVNELHNIGKPEEIDEQTLANIERIKALLTHNNQ